MTILRNILILKTLVIFVFTLLAVMNGGLNLITPFFSPIFAASWQGQFNVDFSLYLILSGIWMAWRYGFSAGGIALGILAPPLGMAFFAPYLVYLIISGDDNPRKLLLGVHA